MLKYLKLFGLFARVSFQDTAAYRLDFLVHFFLAILHLAAELTAVWTIFSNTQSLAGWGPLEVVALLGVFRIMSGTIGMFISPNMRQMMEEIRTGRLDFAIMKPVNTQFFASTRRMVLWRGTDIVFGLGMVAVAVYLMAAQLSPLQVLNFVIMLGSGITIIYSFWLVLGTMAFWFTRINNIEMVFWNVFEAGRYPVDIYRPWLRWGLTYIVPLAFLTTFPAGTLVGKTEPAGTAIAVLVAAIALWLSSQFWRFGLRHYSGASA
jgi:ABC-2 type transport system permease protein